MTILQIHLLDTNFLSASLFRLNSAIARDTSVCNHLIPCLLRLLLKLDIIKPTALFLLSVTNIVLPQTVAPINRSGTTCWPSVPPPK